MKVVAVLPVLAILAGTAGAQTPSAKLGSVEGVVINSVSGDPIKKAIVTLGRMELSTIEPATATDATGHFHFEKVEPGSYVIRAERDGFWDARNRHPGLLSPIKVAEDQHVQDVAIPLLPLATVTGHILDEDGDPIRWAQVVALRYSYSWRGKQLTGVRTTQSNDLGEFEVLNLQPGRYYFQAMASPLRIIPPRTRWTHREEAYPLVFYPNASEAAQATATTVAPGAQITNIDFRLRKVPAYHIRGRVSDGTAGHKGAEGRVAAETSGSNFPESAADSGVKADGTFDLRGLVSGSYTVSYFRFAPAEGVGGSETVQVTGADVNGVDLTWKTGVNVSGAVAVEGPQPKKLEVQFTLAPVQGMGQGGNSTTGADGSFVLAEVAPDVYGLQISNLPPGNYVKTIRFGDLEIKNGEIDLTGRSGASLGIVLGADGGEVDGNVQTASGQPAPATQVTLAPAQEFEGRSDLLKRAVTDPLGNFQIKDVAPGEYKVFAWESDMDADTQSAEFRKPFESRGASLTIGPKDKASVQLSVITVDDVEKEIGKLP